jgi:hypothetical protein
MIDRARIPLCGSESMPAMKLRSIFSLSTGRTFGYDIEAAP